ncbi:hypothetical protein WDW89_05495 [Deltaproteobacteria bacterium TL4]
MQSQYENIKEEIMRYTSQAQQLRKAGEHSKAYEALRQCRKTLIIHQPLFAPEVSAGLLALLELKQQQFQSQSSAK